MERLFHYIGRFFPIIRLQAQSKQRLIDEVVLPAAQLASKIQVAASKYEFYLAPNPFRKYDPVTVDDHKFMKMIDVKTRKTVKTPSADVPDGERRIGHIVTSLEPSLWRINMNEEMTCLRPEVTLVELDKLLPKPSKAPA